MSLLTSQLRFLTLRPSVRETDDAIVIKTGFLQGLCSLFLALKRVEVTPSRRSIVISRRWGYLVARSLTLDFDDIVYLDYSFGSFGTEWGWTSSGYGRHDQLESFAISLVTRDERQHRICAFRGEGAVATGWTGTLLGGDDFLDFSGTQEGESRQLAQYLAKVIGVSIGKPVNVAGTMAPCPACGRETSLYKPTCLYCGADLD